MEKPDRHKIMETIIEFFPIALLLFAFLFGSLVRRVENPPQKNSPRVVVPDLNQ